MLKGQYFGNSYSVQIARLVRIIVKMKLYTSKILKETISILNNYDFNSKVKVFEIAENLKNLTIELEDSVNRIIALSHPVAFDLRFLLSSLKLSAEINYIAHWSKKTIVAIEILETNTSAQGSKEGLTKMLGYSFTTLKDVISILLQFDSKKKVSTEILYKLEKMLKVDGEVDEIYDKILKEGIEAVKSKTKDPLIVFEIIGVAKNIEKISDCINNMIITTKYILTGQRT